MLWKVPVTIATKQNPKALTFLLDTPTKEVTVEGVGPEDWILVRICSGWGVAVGVAVAMREGGHVM